MLLVFQRELRQPEMAFRRGRYHDHVHCLVLNHFLARSIAFDARVILFGIVFACGISLHNGIEFQFGDFSKERDVKDFGGHAIANNADIECTVCHCSMEVNSSGGSG